MQIRRPRGITVPQLMVVTAIGFLGGVYIWRPLILKLKSEQNSDNKSEASAKKTTIPAGVSPATNSPKWDLKMSLSKQFASTTVGMMAIAVGSTIVVYCTNRFLIRPYLNKKQRLESEACAEYIFQQESQRHG